jgi:hypothetical protein
MRVHRRVEIGRLSNADSLWAVVSGATCLASLMFLAAATAASVLTFSGASPDAAQGLASVAFTGAFLAWGAFIISGLAASGGRQRTWSEMLTYSEEDRSWRDALPARVITAVGVSMLVLVASTLGGLGDMVSGSPQEIDGRYYSNNHGELTELTEDEFQRAIGAQTRMFATVAGVFLGASAIGAGTRRNRLRLRDDASSA